MDTSKIIRGVVSNGRYTVTAPIVKEDYGLYLKIEGVELPSTYEVDFSNSENSGTSVTMIGNADGVLIPHQFIDSGKDVFAFLYHVGAGFGRTVYKFRIPNKVRPDRTDDVPTPEEQSTIDQAISALNSAVEQTAQNVSASATNAQSALNASFSASADADRAEEARDDAEGYAEQAEAASTNASTYALNAGNKAVEAAQSAQSASQSAQTASAKADAITGLTATAQTLPEGSSASASYDAQTGVLTLGIPKGADGRNSIDDVQINGDSIVNDGIANIPLAINQGTAGVVKIDINKGIYRPPNSDILAIAPAISGLIKQATDPYRPITPRFEHEATFYGLAKVAGHDEVGSVLPVGIYTEDAKSKISEMLGGSVSVSGTTPTIVAKSGIRYVCGEVATLDFTPSASGICDVVFTSGATATVLTVPSTIKWANGFDPTSLEANTTYEINIMDGLGVAVGWT